MFLGQATVWFAMPTYIIMKKEKNLQKIDIVDPAAIFARQSFVADGNPVNIRKRFSPPCSTLIRITHYVKGCGQTIE